ncbi:putative methyltransferase YcgJ [Devosia equisanguinis]|uniref:Putative methyltransferase YcgJ n=1 Tax=Devosia equisanguinis TaxID=2490941 RepID=A0A447ICB1_9HYPH|nr:class I SAM-dependent methyltransferase [Devosia equisanguinis]VDS05102.1 putative methyltransferase YcgJ [Devosia equisanguinis]
MAASTAFWNNMAERYAASPIANQAAYERKIEATRALFRPDMKIFEFGCGTGSTALRHAPYVGHIRAVDFSENMIAIARAKAEKAGITNVDFAQGDIASLPVERERYDMVMGHSILHLLADPQAAINKSFAMLKPGGYLVTSTACMGWSPLAVLMPIAPLGRALGKLPQLSFFSGNGLEKMQRKAGFQIVHRWHPGGVAAVFFIARKPQALA